MLTIRLQRTGRKHEPTFRVVLTDSKNGPKSGKYLKNLGWFDSRIENKKEQLKTEEIKDWISKGAKLSLTLHNFLVSQKVIEGKKKNALPRKSSQKKGDEETVKSKTEAETKSEEKSKVQPEIKAETKPETEKEAPKSL